MAMIGLLLGVAAVAVTLVAVRYFARGAGDALCEAGAALPGSSADTSCGADLPAGLALAHLSHSYPDGACLYFTVLYPLDAADPLAQWQAIKRDATRAVLDAGGTLSHHHGIGVDHAAWLAEEKGSVGVAALRAVKAALDPRGIMNPGKLLP